MRERIMFVSDLPEEVDPVLAAEQRCPNRVDGRGTPALFHTRNLSWIRSVRIDE
jgi:hypothetical protein